MGIRKTEAVILKSIDYGETSKIIRVQTPKYGRISLLAKGAKSPKSKFGGFLEELNYVSVVFYYKEDKDLFIVSQCDLINPNKKIKEDFNKLGVGFALSELILKSDNSEESNQALFNLLIRLLKELNTTQKGYINLYIYFLLKYMKINGYEINFKSCLSCGKSESREKWYLSIKDGGIYCSECGTGNFDITVGIQKLLYKFSCWEMDRIINFSLSEQDKKTILNLMDNYMNYHVEAYQKPKSLEYMVQ